MAPPIFRIPVREEQVGSAELSLAFRESDFAPGGVDKSKPFGGLTYTAVMAPGYWQIKFGGSNGTSSNDTRATTVIYGDSASTA